MTNSTPSKLVIALLFFALAAFVVFKLFISQQLLDLNEGSSLEYDSNIQKAQKYQSIQLDSACHFAQKAFRIASESNNQDQLIESELLLGQIQFLQTGADSSLLKLANESEKWYKKNNQLGKAFEAAYLKLKISSFFNGHASWEEIDELIQLAEKSGSSKALAEAYYFKMEERDYTRTWSDDVHLLDSSRKYARLINDSILLGKIRILSVLHINGKAASIDSSFLSLKEAIEWNSPELMCYSYESLGLEFLPSPKKLDSAILYLDNGVEVAKNWGSLTHELYAKSHQVSAYIYGSKSDSAIAIGSKLVELSKAVGQRRVEKELYQDMAKVLFSVENLSEGIEYARKAVNLAEAMNDDKSIHNTKRILASFLSRSKRFDEARQIADEMEEWVKGREDTYVNRSLLFEALYLKGMIFEQQEELDSALLYYREMEQVLEGYTDNSMLLAKGAIFAVLLKKEDFEVANEHYNQMASIFSSSYLERPKFVYLKGKLFYGLNKNKEGIQVLNHFLSNYKISGKNIDYKSRTMLAEMYEEEGEFELALQNNKEALRLKLEMEKEEDAVNLERVQSKYELAKKETEIERLDNDRLFQESELLANQSALNTRRFFIILLSLLLVLLVVIIVFVYRRAKETRLREELKRDSLEKEKRIEQIKAQETERSIQLKNQLFANISHEFRTPLTLIQAPVEELMESAGKEESLKLNSVHRNAEHLLSMVEEMLELARFDEGNLALSRKQFGIRKFLEDLLSGFEPTLKQKNLKIEAQFPENEWLVSADEYRLRMVLNNLLKNAFHHTPEGGEIKLSLNIGNDKESFRMSLFNSGKGIEEDFLPHIFNRYSRSKEEEYTGYGIGLSLCKELVHLHQGKISAQNVYGGVLFSIDIPSELKEVQFSDQFNSVKEVEESKLDFPAQSGQTILLVEDNIEMQQLLKEMLQKNYHVIIANNGAEGVELAKLAQPNLILSDVMMPHIEGTELTQILKQDLSTCHIPIVLLTAKATLGDKIAGLEFGADDYISKPFSPKELLVRIGNLLKQREQLKQLFSKNVFIDLSEVAPNILDKQFLTKANQIVEDNLLNATFSVEKFCRELALNRNSVHQKLKSLTGLSASQYINSIKLKHAAILLKDETISIVEISERSGFNNRQAFNKVFKKQFNTTPSEFRKKELEKTIDA